MPNELLKMDYKGRAAANKLGISSASRPAVGNRTQVLNYPGMQKTTKKCTGKSYTQMLEMAGVKTLHDNQLFQGDNCPIHRCKEVKAWLEANVVVKEPWPAYSPLIWAHLRRFGRIINAKCKQWSSHRSHQTIWTKHFFVFGTLFRSLILKNYIRQCLPQLINALDCTDLPLNTNSFLF